jgi:di/tricarboxylate transporter
VVAAGGYVSIDGWVTLAVSVITVVLLAMDRFPPALVMGGAVTCLLLAGVLDQEGALVGFSNEAPIIVAALYVLAGAVEITGAFDRVTFRALEDRRSADTPDRASRRQLVRLTYPSAAASAFIANTPLVGMVAPRVVSWCRRTGRSPSHYLMPLSYAVIFGGCITLIGTSTNLVVSGLLSEFGQRPLSLFEISRVGGPLALVGTTLVVLLAPRLLPARRSPSEELRRGVREFVVEMRVTEGSPLAGQKVVDAGLRSLEGVFLVDIERNGSSIAPVGSQDIIAQGDHLVFAGDASRILDLQRLPGLVSAEERHFTAAGNLTRRRFYQAVVAERSSLVGSTLKETGFRSRYGAAVLAIHRAGERVQGKLGRVPLRAGDVLLVLGGTQFGGRSRHDSDFLLVAPLGGEKPVRREKARMVQALTLGFVVVAGTGLLGLLEASLVVAIALIGLGVVTLGEAKRSIDLEVVLLMGTSFGLGVAMSQSGLADQIARQVVGAFSPLGDLGLLAGITIATMLMTELLSNNAAAVLMFPIAMATAQQAGLQSRPFAVVVLFGATLSFLTPIGYQANTMIWGMGGYRYRDFSRLGAPLTLATLILITIAVPLAFPLR